MNDSLALLGAKVAVSAIQSTSERIYRTAVKDGMPELLASFIVGQSKFETNKYHNKHCQLHLAYFSYMYDPKSKWQVKGGGSIADNGAPVAKYASLENSVHEMTDWIKRRQREKKFPADLNTITDPEQYSHLLYNCGFFQGWKQYTPEQNIDFYANGIERYREHFAL